MNNVAKRLLRFAVNRASTKDEKFLTELLFLSQSLCLAGRLIMGSITVSLIVLACVFGGALLGIFLRTSLPEHHLGADSKDIVKLGMGLVGTMAASRSGLLVASAKGSY
jgi:hypothetical protein